MEFGMPERINVGGLPWLFCVIYKQELDHKICTYTNTGLIRGDKLCIYLLTHKKKNRWFS